MRKKSQGLSITTIVIAAISLIVLVVLIAIFTGRIGIFTRGIENVAADCAQACRGAGYSGGTPQSSGEVSVIKKNGDIQYCKCS